MSQQAVDPKETEKELTSLRLHLFQAQQRLEVLEDLEQRHQHMSDALAKLLELNQSLVTEQDIPHVLSLAMQLLVENITNSADRGSLQLLEANETVLRTVAVSIPGESLDTTLAFKRGVGIAGHALAENKTINVPDVLADERFVPGDKPLKFRSLMVAPLTYQGKLIGTLSLSSQQTNAFGDVDETFVQLVASPIAAVLENARLLAETGESLNRERNLNEMAHVISSALDLPTVLSKVVGLAAELINASAGALALIDDNQKYLTYHYLYNLPQMKRLSPRPVGTGLAWQVVVSGKAIMLADYAQHPQAQTDWIQAGAKAFIAVPVIVGESCLGVLSLFNLSAQQAFDERDLELAKAIGRQTGVAIQNARLYAQEQQRAEALNQALTQQEELARLKQEFIQNVSHELRTPLTIAKGYTDWLASGEVGQFTPPQEKAIATVARRMSMLCEMVDDLFAVLMVEIQGGEWALLDLGRLVRSQILGFQESAQTAQVQLLSDIAPTALTMEGNSNHLRRVVDNLLSNAIKFTPAGGSVTVSLHVDEDWLVLKIADTGIGIPPQQQQRIFDRFYQVDGSITRQRGGTGMGLALVKEVVTAHGGTVSVESKLAEGSVFQIRFPAVIG